MAVFEPVVKALDEEGARYVVVGGMATVLHGYARLTANIDLVVDLEPAAAAAAVRALTGLGLRPTVPVPPEQFADPGVRTAWIREKGMQVFSFFDPENPLRRVDLFVNHPIEFEGLYERSVLVPLTSSSARIASIDDLIRLKELAGRPRDLEDVAQLRRIREAKRDE